MLDKCIGVFCDRSGSEDEAAGKQLTASLI